MYYRSDIYTFIDCWNLLYLRHTQHKINQLYQCQSNIFIIIQRFTITTYPGQDALIRHTKVGTHLYDIPRSGRTFTTYPGRDALLRHTQVGTHLYDIPRVGTHFYDIPRSGRTFTTYPGRDALLRHTQVGTHFYDIPRSGRTFTTCPGQFSYWEFEVIINSWHIRTSKLYWICSVLPLFIRDSILVTQTVNIIVLSNIKPNMLKMDWTTLWNHQTADFVH